MRSRMLIAGALMLGGSALAAQSVPPASVVTAQRLRFLGDSLAPAASRTAQLGAGPGYTFAVTHRDSSGGVEAHTNWTDMLVVQAGSATLLSGGHLEGSSETSPGEWRGGAIVGGSRAALRVGDIIVTPAGTPHRCFSRRASGSVIWRSRSRNRRRDRSSPSLTVIPSEARDLPPAVL